MGHTSQQPGPIPGRPHLSTLITINNLGEVMANIYQGSVVAPVLR